MAMSHVSLTYLPQYHMSNRLFCMSLYFYLHIACHLALCRMSNLINALVVLSILGVNGHTMDFNGHFHDRGVRVIPGCD